MKDVVSRFDRRRYKRRKNGERGAIPYDKLSGVWFRRSDSRLMLVISVAVARAVIRLITLQIMVSRFRIIHSRKKGKHVNNRLTMALRGD